jgi:hypothetical protein
MTIKVYWACNEYEWMRASKPDPVSKKYYSKFKSNDGSQLASINRCPAFNDYLTNLYELKSIYDYEFYIEDNLVKSNMYSEKFFDDHVVIRDINQKWFSFSQQYIFFTEEPSLLMTVYEFPNFENNNITENCHTIPGQFDIGKWFRNTEFPFFLKKDCNRFKIKENEVYSYIRFHTDEPIEFVQFIATDKINEFLNDARNLNINQKRKILSMQYIYSKFNHKDKILSEIKSNIIKQDI